MTLCINQKIKTIAKQIQTIKIIIEYRIIQQLKKMNRMRIIIIKIN